MQARCDFDGLNLQIQVERSVKNGAKEFSESEGGARCIEVKANLCACGASPFPLLRSPTQEVSDYELVMQLDHSSIYSRTPGALIDACIWGSSGY